MADRHALVRFDDAVIFLDPLCGLVGIEKQEGQRTEPVACGQVNRLTPRARHPHRRVRPLHRFRHKIAARHVEPAPLEPGIGPHRQHIGGLSRSLLPHRPLIVGFNPKPAHLYRRCRLAGAPLDTAVRDQIERGNALGDPRRMIVVGRHQGDAVAETNALRTLRAGRKEHLGGRGVRILLQEVVLDLPEIVDADPVGELNLLECVL